MSEGSLTGGCPCKLISFHTRRSECKARGLWGGLDGFPHRQILPTEAHAARVPRNSSVGCQESPIRRVFGVGAGRGLASFSPGFRWSGHGCQGLWGRGKRGILSRSGQAQTRIHLASMWARTQVTVCYPSTWDLLNASPSPVPNFYSRPK